MRHELPNDLRRRNLGCQEIKKYQENLKSGWSHRPAPNPPAQNIPPGSSSQKTRKSRYQTPLAPPSFTGSLYPAPNTPPRTVRANKYVVLTRPSLPQRLIFWHFVYCQSTSSIFMENIKQANCVKNPDITTSCKQYLHVSLDQELTLETFHCHLLAIF